MATKLLIPFLNPLRLFQTSNDNWDYLKTKDWETGQTYCQKWKKSDIIRMQIGVEESTSVQVYPSFSLLTIDGKYITSLGNTVLLATMGGYKWYECIISLATITDGRYIIRMSSVVDTNLLKFYSEPIEIAEAHENTLQFVYSHDENDFDLIFVPGGNQSNRMFQLRIDGGFSSDGFKPASLDSMYVDQVHNAVMLSSVPFNVRTLTIGNSYGIPNWMADKINRIFSCNSVTIDGVAYTKNDGAKLEATRESGYASAGWKIDLLESENSYSEIIT